MTSFVQRQGTRLMLNGQPFYFSGFNIPQYAHDGPTWSSLIDIAQAGCNAIRIWWPQTMSIVNGKIDWTTLDGMLTVASTHGIKVIMTLTWGGDEAYDLPWWQGGYATQIAPNHIVTYESWVKQVVARYASWGTVMMWQLVNEAQPAAGATDEVPAFEAMYSFATTIGSIVKKLDPNHLLNLGNIIGFNGAGVEWGGSRQWDLPPSPPIVGRDDYQLLLANPYLDVGDYHDYGWPSNPLGFPNEIVGLQGALTIGNALSKPIMVAETGIDWTNNTTYNPPISPNTLAARAPLFQAKFAAQFAAGVVGVCVWAWRDVPGPNDGSVYGLEVGPGDPVLGYMAATNYTHA
jgi:hypothetical protein